MTAITRVTDQGQGFCVDHSTDITTIFTQGAPTVFINNLAAGAVTHTIGEASCTHPSIATTGSSTVFFNNQAVHRLNDKGIVDGGEYAVITASPNVFAGG